MSNCTNEIIGIKKIALYTNKDVSFNYPDISVYNEIDSVSFTGERFVIDEVRQSPKWERILKYSRNYKQNYIDEFTFLLHGIENTIPETLTSLRNNRYGYIVEVITTAGNSYVFPSPVFLNNENVKQVDSHSWEVSLSYREATFNDKLNKLNTVLST